MEELRFALALSRARGVGAATFRRLLDLYKVPSEAFRQWHETHSSSVVLSSVSQAKSDSGSSIDKTLSEVEKGNMQAFYYGQQGYPFSLAELGEPPPVIFVRGHIPFQKMAAVVGARKKTSDAEAITQAVVAKLVADGYCVVSGGAAGIDTVAHKTSLRLEAKTVAVLGTGLDISYPAENKCLFDKIAMNGALLTELMVGAKPMKSFFPTRNRLIAALAEVIVVVQASEKSGSMITAKWGQKLGRKVFTIAPQTNCRTIWSGNRKLIDSGVKLFDC